MSQLSQFDPSTAQPGENNTTYATVEEQVSLAYSVAMQELNVLVTMVNEVERPPPDDLEALIRYRDIVVQDVRRLGMRLQLSMKYLKAKDRQSHYHAKRLRTKDKVNRLRLWDREKNQELVAVHLQSGESGYEAAWQAFEEQKRVMIACYGLGKYWERAMKREMCSQTEGDDLSSGCETSMEE